MGLYAWEKDLSIILERVQNKETDLHDEEKEEFLLVFFSKARGRSCRLLNS